MDNLPAHKPAGVRTAIGAELRYLPPYSPDFNPIEQAFAYRWGKVILQLHQNRCETGP